MSTNMTKSVTSFMDDPIGDGANDVSMIQSAHVGVGINGQEGMQAVLASDFAIPRFKFLKRLLLVHGHWNYDRLARLIQYIFYKNFILALTLFWFELFSGFSSQPVLSSVYLMGYNTLFTSFPCFAYGIFEKCASETLLEAHPKLYAVGRESKLYGRKTLWILLADSLWQSAVAFFFPFVTWPTFSSIIFGILVYFVFTFTYTETVRPGIDPNPAVYLFRMVFADSLLISVIIFSSVFGVLPRLTIRILMNSLWPSNLLIAKLKEHAETAEKRKNQQIT